MLVKSRDLLYFTHEVRQLCGQFLKMFVCRSHDLLWDMCRQILISILYAWLSRSSATVANFSRCFWDLQRSHDLLRENRARSSGGFPCLDAFFYKKKLIILIILDPEICCLRWLYLGPHLSARVPRRHSTAPPEHIVNVKKHVGPSLHHHFLSFLGSCEQPTLTFMRSPSPSVVQTTGSKLVGQPLLYAISCFASLGVFLVRIHAKIRIMMADFPSRSLAMTRGKATMLPVFS